jgi:hypothetical protein
MTGPNHKDLVTRAHRLQHHPAVALNKQGYYVGRIERNLYRVTD